MVKVVLVRQGAFQQLVNKLPWFPIWYSMLQACIPGGKLPEHFIGSRRFFHQLEFRVKRPKTFSELF